LNNDFGPAIYSQHNWPPGLLKLFNEFGGPSLEVR
jgi:hypothetical protein